MPNSIGMADLELSYSDFCLLTPLFSSCDWDRSRILASLDPGAAVTPWTLNGIESGL
jgi:hypothetical protein